MWDFRWWLAETIETAAAWISLRLKFSRKTRDRFGIDTPKRRAEMAIVKFDTEKFLRLQRERERLERLLVKNLPWWKKHAAVIKAKLR